MYRSHFRRRAVAALAVTAIGLAATGGPALAAQSDPAPDLEQLTAASLGETTVFGIDAGDLLQLRLLGEDGLASIDDVGDVTEALTRLVPLDISSATLPALDAASLPALEAHSTDGENRTEASNPAIGEGLPLDGLLGGNVTATLLALVNDTGAQGLTDATVENVSALAGLVGLESITATLGSDASSAEAAGSRSVNVSQITALDLTGLLQLLGLDLLDLELDQLTGLAGGLGVLDGVLEAVGLSSADLDAILADPLSVVDSLQTALTAATAEGAVLADVCDAIGDLGLPLNCEALADITALITTLQTQLDGVLDLLDLDELLGVLDGAPLLAFGGIDAGVFATAGRTVEDSLATVDATVGEILVAGQVLPGLDVGSTLEDVNALTSQVTGALDGVLGIIGLDGIVDIGILEETTSVTETDGVITALAELTGLRITITPPDVCALLSGIDPTGTVGGLLGELDLPLPELPVPVVGDLLGDLGGTLSCGVQPIRAMPGQAAGLVNALSQPLTIQAANISETSVLDVTSSMPATPADPQSPTPVNLPRTGSDIPLLPLLALVIPGAYGIRFLIRRSSEA